MSVEPTHTIAATGTRIAEPSLGPPDPPGAKKPLVHQGPSRIPLERVIRNSHALRELDPAVVTRLTALIPKYGLVHHIVVAAADSSGNHQVIDGEHRLAAYKALAERDPKDPRWRTIPAIVRTDEPDRAELVGLIANIVRKQFTPAELAAAILRLRVERGLSNAAIARELETDPMTVSRSVRCLEDVTLARPVLDGILSPNIAAEFLVAPAEFRPELVQRAKQEKWTQLNARAAAHAARQRERNVTIQPKKIERAIVKLDEMFESLSVAELTPSGKNALLRLRTRLASLDDVEGADNGNSTS